jgi:predicted ATPase with chaperone activity
MSRVSQAPQRNSSNSSVNPENNSKITKLGAQLSIVNYQLSNLMLVKTYAAAVNGLQVNTVTVEASVETGQQLILTGLGDEAIRESQSRIRLALKYSNLRFPSRSITINLSPANLRKEGSGFDLPMAIAILAGDEKLPTTLLNDYMMMGELGLDGSLKPIIGALPIAIKAREEGFKGLIVPKENSHEAAVVNNLDVYGMSSLSEVIEFLSENENDNVNENENDTLRYDTAQAPTIRPAGYDNGKERIHCNAQMTEKMIHKYAKPDEEGMEMLRKAMERFSLSARAYSRILKVARTIADLDGSEQVKSQHIAEAIGYRMLDRGDWAER